MLPTRDLTQNPGVCPDWESNQQPFALLYDAQPTKPHQSGLLGNYFNEIKLMSTQKPADGCLWQLSSQLPQTGSNQDVLQ